MAKISQSEGLLHFELVSLKLTLKLNWEVRMMKAYKELIYRYQYYSRSTNKPVLSPVSYRQHTAADDQHDADNRNEAGHFAKQ